MRLALLVVLVLLGCRRAVPPPVPDAGEAIEMLAPQEVKDQVNDTLQKEHERTLDPKVE